MDTETVTITVQDEKFQLFLEAVTALNVSSREAAGGKVVLDYQKVKHTAALVLGLIDPTQPYGTELFDALCHVTVTVAIEVACLRLTGDQNVEVLLIQRRADDTAYPGEWHCPGSALRRGESYDDVFARLSRGEFWAEIRSKEFLEHYTIPHEARGHFLSLIYLCDVAEGTKGTWFPVSALPEKTVTHHRDFFIPTAVKAFLARHGK